MSQQIHVDDAFKHSCPWRDFEECLGKACMAWAWSDDRFERVETDNLTEVDGVFKPAGAPPKPEGEGWQMDGPHYTKGYHRSMKDKLPPGIGQRWVRERGRTFGRCGRMGDAYSF